MSKWWIENTVSGIGQGCIGTFNDALQSAGRLIFSDISKVAIWNSDNRKVAEIGFATRWIAEEYRK